MPWTFYRYILWDLLRLLILGTWVLSMLVAVALAIKPLADGLLQPFDLLRFIFYSMPTLIGFTAPFAGAFASVMTFRRMAADNEITAAAAGGMSYWTILMPVIVFGWGLGISLFVLSNWVVPDFYRASASMLQRDVTNVIVRQVKKRQATQIGKVLVFAERADILPEPNRYEGARHQPIQSVNLDRVALGEIDPATGMTTSDHTAAAASLDLYNILGQPVVKIRLRDVVFHRRDKGTTVRIEDMSVVHKVEKTWRNKPKFLTWNELKELGRNPENGDEVKEAKVRLAQRMAVEQIVNELTQRLRKQSVTLPVVGEQAEYTINAPQASRHGDWVHLEARGDTPIRINYRLRGTESRQIRCQQAVMKVSTQTLEPRITIDLEDQVIVRSLRTGVETGHKSIRLPVVAWPEEVVDHFAERDINGLLGLTREPPYSERDVVQAAGAALYDSVVELRRKVIARLHIRTATAFAAWFILVLGAVMAIKAKGRLPLLVYFWVFALSLADIIVIHAGRNVLFDRANPYAEQTGMIVIWSGNLLVLAMTTWFYVKVKRN